MKHKYQHKQIPQSHRKYRNIAAAFAGAAILSAAMLPGITGATVHAAANPNANQPPVSTSQKQNPVTHKNKSSQQKSKTNANTPLSVQKGKSASQQKTLSITATAYAPGAHDNDQWGNKTFIGSQIRPGVIAVDPNVIPLGSRVHIEYPDGHSEYAIAEDTGGAIKGNRIDVAKWSVKEAEDFGIQHVKVTIVSTPDKA